jgi:HD-GYP domain-containing protein (c-di-GMP phosphodiesterase class II)
MIQQHHERLDGSGYPNKLVGDQICQGARVLAVADTIEAMATHRPYRAALGLNAAMQTLRAQADISIDKNVLDAAFRLMNRDNTLEKLIQS